MSAYCVALHEVQPRLPVSDPAGRHKRPRPDRSSMSFTEQPAMFVTPTHWAPHGNLSRDRQAPDIPGHGATRGEMA